MPVPATCKAAVFIPDTGAFELRSVPVSQPEDDEVLAKVSLSAVCGSDLHTVSGRRRPSGPLILGHEICGTIAATGPGVRADFDGRPLREGDRVTWGIAARCGECFFCTHGMPQKCKRLFKYGHEPIERDPPLSGGFAEYVHLTSGTPIFRLDDRVPDRVAVFANCSLATAAAAMRIADLRQGESILIQGAGLVGLCCAALAASRHAGNIVIADVSAERLERAAEFAPVQAVRVEPDGAIPDSRHVFDVAVEACGEPRAVRAGIEALRIGGRYVLLGCVYPESLVEIDLHRVVFKLLELRGCHNYRPEDLRTGLELLRSPFRPPGFDNAVAKVLPLDEIEHAVAAARERRDWLRVAVAPA